MTRARDVADRAVITTADLVNIPSGAKNLIINGDMRIAQRGTSVTGITGGDTYKTLDRWRSNLSSAGTWTMEQDTDVPSGQGFATSMKWSCTTANASLSAGSYAYVTQYLEGQNLQHLKKGTANAESLTLSFWVKSNKAGTYIAELFDTDTASYRTISKSYTIDTADTWEKKTITFEGDTVGALNNDNGRSLDLWFHLVAGTDFTSGTLQTSWAGYTATNRAVGQTVNLADSTSNYINITGVQLEVGTEATPFEHRPYDMELARCQRYYEKSYAPTVALGTAGGTGWCFEYIGRSTPNNYGYCSVRYATSKRANASVIIWSYLGVSGEASNGDSGASLGGAGTIHNGTSSFTVLNTSGSAKAEQPVAFHFEASAEL